MMSKVLKRSPAHLPGTIGEEPSSPPPPKPSPWRWVSFALLIAAAAAAYYYVPWKTVVALVPALGGRAEPKAPPPRVIPVVAVATHQGEMDIYLNALGSVTALKTVTLRSRVDGELLHVAFTEGQVMRKGDLLAEIDPRPFEAQKKQIQGQILKDQSALKIAQLNLDRYEALLPNRTVTQQQFDEQKALVEQCTGAIAADEAQINNIDLQLLYCRITAPIPGTIGLRMVDPGNMVKANDPTGMAVINQLQPITVVFTIPQDEIARVQRQINTGRKLSVEAFDRDFRTKLADGQLMALDNQVDPATGTVRLKAMFENKDNMLFPNQFVNVRMQVETKHDAIIAPAAAVQQGPDGTFVYVVGPDSTVSVQKVQPGPTEGNATVIEQGLPSGALVVVDGVDKLQQGTKVAVRERGGHERPVREGPSTASSGRSSSQGSE